ncbi:MAG: hypothetical protein K9G76_02820 [Bacteroidales bacterium]|nr:hypothetical protein [Bacteroidales bacterium]MCF8402727.1 hypothetical protein [Bacteroidales bacterium]
MKRVIFLFLPALILVFTSCSRDEDTTINQPETTDSYIPLHIGNYWVFDQYKIDTLGIETLMDTYDSLVITGVESINGKSYYVFEGTWLSGPELTDTVYMLRDSSGYCVDPLGWIHFTDQNFVDTLETFTMVSLNNDTLYESYYKVLPDPQIVSVPAGEFEALNYQGTIFTHNPNQGVPPFRYKDQYFTNNVGMVLDTYFYLGSPVKMERRLKNYFIDPGSFN